MENNDFKYPDNDLVNFALIIRCKNKTTTEIQEFLKMLPNVKPIYFIVSKSKLRIEKVRINETKEKGKTT